jgi:hypothetical protein
LFIVAIVSLSKESTIKVIEPVLLMAEELLRLIVPPVAFPSMVFKGRS